MTCNAVNGFSLFVFLLVTLASAQENTFPVTLEHDNGTVTFEQAPERVAVLGLRSLEVLAALDLQAVAVATTNALPSDAGGQLETVPGYEELVTGPVIYLGTSETPSLETLARVQPDLILDENPGAETRADLLSEIAPTVAYGYYMQDSWQNGLREIAKLFGRSAEAEGYLENYNHQVANLRDSLAASGETIAIIIVYEQNLILLDPNNSIADLIAELGFSIAVPEGLTGDEQGFVFLSLEALAELQADNVLLINRGGDAGTLQRASDLLVNLGEGLFVYDYPPTLGINGPYSNILLLNDLVELFNN
jgi:iron complex transport system substrate-binding protein